MKKMFFVLAVVFGILCGSQQAMARVYNLAEYNAAYELFDAMQMSKTLDDSVAMMLEQQIQMNPALAEYRATMQRFLGKYMSFEAIKKDLAEAYLSVFSCDEMKELSGFYKTSVGQKFVVNQSRLMHLGMEIGQKQVEAHANELQAMIMSEMNKK